MKQSLKLIKIKIEGVRTIVLFRVDPYQPVLVPFIFQILQLKGKAFSTIKNKLVGLKYFYEYFLVQKKFDVDELLINKKFNVILNDLEPFIYWLTYSDNVIGIHAKQIYLSGVKDFLTWAFRRYSSSDSKSKSVQDMISSFTRYFPSTLPTRSSSLTSTEVSDLLKYSNPSLLENPFRERDKDRNYIIINILLFTGIRIGELLKLKSSDIHDMDDNCYIEIINRENDLEDSRSDEPGLKNSQSQRVISLKRELYDSIQDYIFNSRRPFKEGKKTKLSHGYLFTSERGLPLSKSSVYYIFNTLKACIITNKNKFESNLTPHSFRHVFAENFLEDLIEVQGLEMERAKDQLRIIGGWSINSEMPSFYAKKYISRSANQYNLSRINNSFKKTNA